MRPLTASGSLPLSMARPCCVIAVLSGLYGPVCTALSSGALEVSVVAVTDVHQVGPPSSSVELLAGWLAGSVLARARASLALTDLLTHAHAHAHAHLLPPHPRLPQPKPPATPAPYERIAAKSFTTCPTAISYASASPPPPRRRELRRRRVAVDGLQSISTAIPQRLDFEP